MTKAEFVGYIVGLIMLVGSLSWALYEILWILLR